MLLRCASFIGVTDYDWFRLHAGKPVVDDVNFWRPSPAFQKRHFTAACRKQTRLEGRSRRTQCDKPFFPVVEVVIFERDT